MLIRILAFYSDGISTSTRRGVAMVYANIDLIVLNIVQARRLCRVVVDIVDVTICWIGAGEEVEFAGEIIGFIVVHY